MAAIRVMIGDMPQLLRSLVEGVLDEDPQFELMIGAEQLARPDGGRRDFDVLVVSESAMKAALPGASALERRELGIVAISPDGQGATVIHLNAHRRRLEDRRRQSLSRAILDAAGQARQSHR